jgi:Mn2+/Fe2+ NRAMP family transporter
LHRAPVDRLLGRRGVPAAWDINDSFVEAQLFYLSYGAMVALAAAIVLIPGAPLVSILFLSQALNAVLLLLILPFMRRLAQDPR